MNETRLTPRKELPTVIWLTVCIAIGGAYALWTPHPTSEDRAISPDGRHIATATNLTRQRGCILLCVRETASRRNIYEIDYVPSEKDASDNGNRSGQPVITWARDSSSVTFDVGSAKNVLVPIP